MDIYSYYEDAMDEVFEQAPSALLEKLLEGNSNIGVLDIIKLSVHLERKWEPHRKYNIQFGIIIDEEGKGNNDNKLYDYNFNKDISEIIKAGTHKSVIYIIDLKGNIIKKQCTDKELTFDKISQDSYVLKTVAFFLGINGIDVLIRGNVYKTKNHLNSYRDMIFLELLSITDYKNLLNRFFLNEVQYDPLDRYFMQKKNAAKSLYGKLDKHPKLLHSKPEKHFQTDLEFFLKQNCVDQVLTEVHNKNDDRYDIWVSTSDNQLYVFELKWLGKSITPDGTIFSLYDSEERAIEGAYQLKDYVDNAEKYSYLLSDIRIHCAILVIYDARDNMDDIVYPKEFDKYPQIDLNQHFKIEKKKIAASQVYSQMVKN